VKNEEITVLAGHRIVSPWVMKLCMDVAKAERESCAKVADSWKRNCKWENGVVAANIAKEIRERGLA